MASALYALGRFAYRRAWYVIVAWLVLLGAAFGAAQAFSGPVSTAFSIPGIPSEKTQQLLSDRFAGQGENPQTTPSFTVVMRSQDGTPLTTPEHQDAVAALLDEVRAIPDLVNPDAVGLGQIPPEALQQMTAAPSPGQPAPGQPASDQIVAQQDWLRAVQAQTAQLTQQAQAQGMPAEQATANAAVLSNLSADGRTFKVDAQFDEAITGDAMELDARHRDAVAALSSLGDAHGLDVTYNGPATQEASVPGGTAEAIGIVIALIVLAITFGSVVGATMPIFTALVGVGIAVMTVSALSGVIDVSDMTPILATMLGLAVAIDYSLFIASRYRHEVRLTDDRSHAAGRAVGTAGSSVTFAGTTVFIALAALSILRIPFLTTMALAAAGAVVLSVLIALTLLPAVFGALRGAVFAVKIPGVAAPDPEDEGVHTMGERIARGIRRRPASVLIASVAVLAVLAGPAASMRLALPTDAVLPSDTPQRQAVEMIADGWGPGANARMMAVVDAAEVPEAERMAVYDDALQRISGVDGVANAQLVATNGKSADPAQPAPGDAAQIVITPTTGPVDEATTELIHALRSAADAFSSNSAAEFGVTGLTAIEVDISERLSNSLVPYLAIVIGLAFVLLTVVFRSIIVPLIAALGFLLSVVATLGATVAIFQWGWLGLVEGQPLISFLPIILIGLVFGLAMDYQVFLVSRMREAYHHGQEAHESVLTGYKYGARVVTAAALIMISVFGAFIAQDMAFIKSMGFALAAAILFDAFVVRMLIVPAVMNLLGDKAWWLPRWLGRVIPRVDIEGEKLPRTAPAV